MTRAQVAGMAEFNGEMLRTRLVDHGTAGKALRIVASLLLAAVLYAWIMSGGGCR